MRLLLFLFAASTLTFSCMAQDKKLSAIVPLEHASIITQEFVSSLEDIPTPECHALTIEVSNDIVITSWYGTYGGYLELENSKICNA